MNHEHVRQAVAQIVSLHLRELPNTALEAACDLISLGGSEALVQAITEEIADRKIRSLRF